MKLKRSEVLVIYQAMQGVKAPDFELIKDLPDKGDYLPHAKFLYILAQNKRKLKEIVSPLEEAGKPMKEYTDYLRQRMDIIKQYAQKDDKGKPLQTRQIVNGQVMYGYVVPELNDDTSEVSQKLKKLEEDNKEILDAQAMKEKQYEELSEEEINVSFQKIDISYFPKGLSPEMMDGLMYMVDDETKAEQKK